MKNDKIRGRVKVQITSGSDGWGRGCPKILSVKTDDGEELTGELRDKAIKQTCYPSGGVDWQIWSVGEIDDFGFIIYL